MTGWRGSCRPPASTSSFIRRVPADGDGLERPGVTRVERYDAFFGLLEHPRLFLLDLPLGRAIDRAIDAAYVFMEPGDVVLDPSGSYWGDTLRRYPAHAPPLAVLRRSRR